MKIRIRGMFGSLSLAGLFVLNFQSEIVHAQTTAFSYQGQLAGNGVPVSGTYNLTFSLFNAASGGSAVAGPVVTNGVVVNNGLFYATIDFGAGVWNGQTNWLQIGVETNGAASFTTLAPRQEVLPVPYAIFANGASNLLGTLPATQLSGAVPLAQLPAGVLTNDETASVTLNNLTLNGVLNLPAIPVTINAGDSLLLRADNNLNFFSGPYAGNATTSGRVNTAIGGSALEFNTSGDENTANGFEALGFNTSGGYNTADGTWVLNGNVSGSYNTAVGDGALEDLGNGSSGGTNNIAVGYFAGFNFNGNESGNIDIGNSGVRGESGVIRIGTPGTQTAAYIAGNLTLNGTLNLPPIPVTITAGGSPLLYVDNNENSFSGFSGNLTISGGDNTANGYLAIHSDTSGDLNTANGAIALYHDTSGSENTANGYFALGENSIGNENTANGVLASQFNQSGSYNTADGAYTLSENISGNFNTAEGYGALHNIGLYGGTGGSENIALGHGAGSAFTNNESTNIDIGNDGVGGENGVIRIGTPGIQTATYIAGEIIGDGGGLTNVSTYQLGGTISLAQLPAAVITNDERSVTMYNLTLNGALNLPSVEYGEPVAIFSGNSLLLWADYKLNFFSGPNAGNPVSTGSFNTADGAVALSDDTSGNANTAIGEQALQANQSGYDNTASGAAALQFNTSGNDNTAIGSGALSALGISNGVGGTNNIALGCDAGFAFTNNESYNIDIGNMGVGGESGVIRIGTPGVQTAAFIAGNLTLNGTLNLPAGPVSINSGDILLLSAGNNNNFFAGPNSGNLTTSGGANTADGAYALDANTSGSGNAANGFSALYNNTSGNLNTANGNSALASNVNGSFNTANGSKALEFNISGNNNTANGYEALYFNTNGNFNMADGEAALYYNRSGNYNTAIGWGALQNLGLGNGAGGTNNIIVGYNAGSAFSENESSNIDIGNSGVPGESGIVRVGTPGIQTATYLSGTVYANGVALSSDRNAKEHFAEINARAVLDKVVALPVSRWNYKSDKEAEHIGPMAQDFHAAFGLDGADDKHISVVDENGVALAAIQGLNEKLETENAELKKRLDELEAQIKALSEKKQ